MWATPFATERQARLRAARRRCSAPGRESFGPAMIIDPDIEEATGTSPDLAVSSTGQADVVYRVVELPAATSRCCAPATSSSRCASRTSTGERWTSLGESTANRASSMRPPTAGQRPGDRDRPDRQRHRRVAGARSRRRRADLGAAPVRPDARLRDAGHRDRASASAPDRSATRTLPASPSPASARPRSPTARPPASARRCPGPRIFLNMLPDGESASGAEFDGARIADPAVVGGKAATSGAAEHRHRRTPRDAPAVRRQRRAAGDRRQRQRARGHRLARPADCRLATSREPNCRSRA